jgi:hypothetical protein
MACDRPQFDEVAEARKVLLRAHAWIGWELYERDGDSICLDGEFTIAELEALLVVIRQQQSLQLIDL